MKHRLTLKNIATFGNRTCVASLKPVNKAGNAPHALTHTDTDRQMVVNCPKSLRSYLSSWQNDKGSSALLPRSKKARTLSRQKRAQWFYKERRYRARDLAISGRREGAHEQAVLAGIAFANIFTPEVV